MLLAHKGGSDDSMSSYVSVLGIRIASHHSDLVDNGIEFSKRVQSRRERIHESDWIISLADPRRCVFNSPTNGVHARNGTTCGFQCCIHGCNVGNVMRRSWNNGDLVVCMLM
jgi:hypothetical protein